MNFGIFATIALVAVFLANFETSSAVYTNFVDDSARLRQDLFGNRRYDKFNPPTTVNSTWARGLVVYIRLLVIHVLKLEEALSSMTINGWLLMHWYDLRLRWNTSEYGDSFSLRVPDRSIWIPDIVLYNDIEAMQTDNAGDMDMHVYNDGAVYWVAPVTLKSTCYADIKLYPFDEQRCTINLGSWSAETRDMFLKAYYIDTEHEAEVLGHFFTENPQWELLGQKQEVANFSYLCCPDNQFQTFKVHLHLRRRSPFYKFMLVSPSVLAMMLTLAIFWIPPDVSINKFVLGGTVVVVEVVVLLFLGWQLPAGGNHIPSIVLFCGNALVMTSLSLIASIVTQRISRTSGKNSVPDWLKTFLGGIGGKVLCLNALESNIWVQFISKVHSFPNTRDKNDPQLIDSGEVQIGISEEQEDGPQRTQESNGMEWTEVATAADRACFLFFCFVFAIITIASFTQ